MSPRLGRYNHSERPRSQAISRRPQHYRAGEVNRRHDRRTTHETTLPVQSHKRGNLNEAHLCEAYAANHRSRSTKAPACNDFYLHDTRHPTREPPHPPHFRSFFWPTPPPYFCSFSLFFIFTTFFHNIFDQFLPTSHFCSEKFRSLRGLESHRRKSARIGPAPTAQKVRLESIFSGPNALLGRSQEFFSVFWAG